MKNAPSLYALIALMDDPDEQIYQHVKDQLLAVGKEAIPILETSWEERDYGLLFQSRIESLIHEIQFESCKNQLINWYEQPTKDLLEGAIIIAQYQYPGLDPKVICAQVERIRKAVWLELNPHMTAFENVSILNKVFFEQFGFVGNSKNYTSPLNSYINTVLESKKGNPLSLSIVYSVVAQQLGFPIYGVNLPNHFILAYMDEHGVNQFISDANEYGVLFYINTFSKGSMFQKDDINQFLKGLNIKPNPAHFQPCSNSDILRRMITNLIASFQQVGNVEKVNELTELRTILG
jgi:regulator of sirC expression with transglutaminase-like and TPR domain